MPNYNSRRDEPEASNSEKDFLQKLQQQLQDANTAIHSIIKDSNQKLQSTKDLLKKLL